MIDHAIIKSLFRNHSSNRKNFFPQISFRYNDIITNNNKGFASKPIFDFFFFFFIPFRPHFRFASDVNDQQKQRRDESTRETEIQRMGKYTVNDRSCIFVSGYNTHL